jgi:hypothetical protein
VDHAVRPEQSATPDMADIHIGAGAGDPVCRLSMQYGRPVRGQTRK